jgi:hypothetical protein
MGLWLGSSGQVLKQICAADHRGPVLVYALEAAFEPASHCGSARAEQPGNFLYRIAAVEFDASTVYAMAGHA